MTDFNRFNPCNPSHGREASGIVQCKRPPQGAARSMGGGENGAGAKFERFHPAGSHAKAVQAIFKGFGDRAEFDACFEQLGGVENAIGLRSRLRLGAHNHRRHLHFEDTLHFLGHASCGHGAGIGDIVDAKRGAHLPNIQAGFDAILDMRQ